ncbi:MAG: peptide chain release factor N(5)-glutamine methyltransferase [Bacilli bacterium]
MNNEELIKKYVKEEDQQDAFKKLKNGIPVQYIIGNVDFLNCNFLVNNSVLIPRFETELLVEKTINYIKSFFNKKVNIIDLGTGSGCIAITLFKETNSSVTGVDISRDAIEVAKENNIRNNSDVFFYIHDILNKPTGLYDVLISNPPYIKVSEEVEEIVLNNEPHIALFASDEGLLFYKSILDYSKGLLQKRNIIAFEISPSIKESLEAYLLTIYPHSKYSFECDLTGKVRYLFIFNE